MRKIIMLLAAVMLLLVASGVAVGTSDEADERGVIIGFEERSDRAGRERLVEGIGGRVSHSYTIINAMAAHIPPEAMDGLRRNPHVNYIEEDYTVKATEQQLPWGVDRIGAPIVHGYNRGTGIKVAILDTGIDRDHPDLSVNYKGGIDYANDDGDPMDDNGHGTHCAGIAGAVGNEIGVIGVAPEASIYGVKVLNIGGSGSISDIIAGIEWSVNNSMQIISMSFGGDYPSEALEDACNASYNSGVLLVAAAGNDGNWAGIGNSVDYPARYDSVIAVAATDSNNARAPWSSTGPAVELAAPGVDIKSTYWDDTYMTKQGTSMACPHVSGTAALVMASDPELSNVEVRERLQTTADDLGTPGRDNLYGYGLVDADEAAPSTGNIPPVADAGSDQAAVVGETVEFNGSGSSDPDGTIVSYDWNFGDGTPTGTGVTTTHAYSATGIYTVNLTVTDDGGATDTDTADVTVTNPANEPPVADAGSDQAAVVGETVEFNGSGSTDQDGTIVSYDWDFGDGTPTGTGVTTTHAYSSPDTYTVNLTVTDDGGATDTDAITVTVTEGSPTNTMHVDSIDMNLNSAYQGQIYYATARVTIVDATGSPVVGANVSCHWEGATNDQDSGLTGQTGQTPNLRSDIRWQRSTPSGTAFTFVVDGVTKDEWTYNPDANEETEDDVTVP